MTPLAELLGSPYDQIASSMPAIADIEGGALTHSELQSAVASFASVLTELGIGPRDRVATVLPNGPATAITILSTMAAAACAPLNPASTGRELESALTDLDPTAIILPSDHEGPAHEVVARRRISVIEVDASRAATPEGVVVRRAILGQRQGAWRPQTGPDTALLLHTSGTTSRPKLVPLTRTNLRSSTAAVVSSLELVPSDRCLGVMPLFHIHGIVATLLAPLAAGGTAVCAPRFRRSAMIDWIFDSTPTWYSAVPTMHQALLADLRSKSRPLHGELRFVRSSSAPLAPSIARELEHHLGAPVIEAYGMTEAAHQIASNALPPRQRKPGSVGVATGTEIAILDGAGRRLPPRTVGEIAIRGPNVTDGYFDASGEPTTLPGGWLRTGDGGSFDDDGFLYITARLKEVINRGGEKIAPREIEEVLLEHPAIEEAVAFPLPHASLGEEPAAVVVARTGFSASESELQAFVAERLAQFKVPARVAIANELPTGATGKVQRRVLADRLTRGGIEEQGVGRRPRAS